MVGDNKNEKTEQALRINVKRGDGYGKEPMRVNHVYVPTRVAWTLHTQGDPCAPGTEVFRRALTV